MVVVVAVLWLTVGSAAALVMHRRVHDSSPGPILFVFLGPLALSPAVSRVTKSILAEVVDAEAATMARVRETAEGAKARLRAGVAATAAKAPVDTAPALIGPAGR